MRPKYGGNGQGPLETLEEPLYVSSPLGFRARIGTICRGCELEISGTLLTVDLRIMEMSEFDVILGMDWLIAYRIVIDCERRRVTAYTQDGTRVVFQRGKHGDPMVTDHWFMQLEKVLEAMEITSDATRIRLAAFQLENEAQIWWKWARTSRDLRGAFVREFSPRI